MPTAGEGKLVWDFVGRVRVREKNNKSEFGGKIFAKGRVLKGQLGFSHTCIWAGRETIMGFFF